MSYFLGLDGGGSKTAALIAGPTLESLGQGTGGPSNYLRVGIQEASLELGRAIREAAANARIAVDDITYAYCGIAGADHPIAREVLVRSLRTLFPRDNFTVDSDARIALTGAIGLGEGIVVIAGTGSVAFGRNQQGEEERAGGWGPTIGDEGSGYAIARRGLSAVVRAFDGRGTETKLTELLCSEYGMCEPEELPYFVYAPTTHADDIARYCRVVIDAAQAGDEVARHIFESEGRELASTVLAVARKLRMLEHPFRVAFVGGAFKAGELLLDPLRRGIRESAPGAELHPPLEAPVRGALRMALRAAEHPRRRL